MMKKKGKTETEEKECGEEREKTTETRTVHVMWKNSLLGGHDSHNNKRKRMHKFQTALGRQHRLLICQEKLSKRRYEERGQVRKEERL